MKTPLKILMLEDNANDAELVQQFLLKSKPNCEFRLVMTEEEFRKELIDYHPDLILSDNTLPQFNATEALAIFNQHSLPIPFILVTGTVSEEFAANVIKLGADDYILKDRLTRLPGAIDAALKKKKTEVAIKHSEEVRKLVMNAALDAIVCMDPAGLITVWNPQAEHLFGWKESEALEKELVDLIIPERYRERHTNGIKNYRETGERRFLNKVVEISALNCKGKEFPIELAIVHIKQETEDFFCAFIRDITERKKAEEQLKSMEMEINEQKIQEQKKTARAIIKAQEQERNRLGQELHDNVNQILAGTKMYLIMAGKKNETVKELIKYPIELIDSSIEEIRQLSHRQVTPLKDIDLEKMVMELLNSHNLGGSDEFRFDYAINNMVMSDDLKLNIYRIIQEQLNNILKYANAKNVIISIRADKNNIGVIIKDDGKGFDVKKKSNGIGLSNMKNRVETYNGKLSIASAPGEGCEVFVSIPAL